MMGAGLIPTMIAFAIGTVSLMPIGICFEELTAAISISSGIIEYVEYTFGRNIGLGFVTGWMLLLDNTPLCPLGNDRGRECPSHEGFKNRKPALREEAALRAVAATARLRELSLSTPAMS